MVGTALLVVTILGSWAYARTRIARVATVELRTGRIVESLAISGRVAAPATVTFLASESTSIADAPVDEGAHVSSGQLLLHLDDAEALAVVAQAEAALAQARAGTREVQNVASKTAAADLNQARAQYEEARRIAEQDESLFARGLTTAAELDRSRTALTVARARRRSAQLAAAATSKNGSQWQAAVAAETFAEAGLVAAKRRAERLSVRAPAAGIVIERNVEVGDDVGQGTKLMTLVLDGVREVVLDADEKNLAKLAVGQPALVSAEAFPDQSFNATVRYIAPAVDAARGTIEVRLAILDPPDYLRTDMTVSVDIAVGSADAAATLPRSTVVDLGTPDPSVLVLKDGSIVRQTVSVGLRGEERVQILGGLEVGQAVVDAPISDLEVGDRAQPVR